MNPTIQKARRAVLVAIGVAVSTLPGGLISSLSAEDSPLLQALRMPEIQRLPPVQPVQPVTHMAPVPLAAATFLDDESDADAEKKGEESEETLEEQFKSLQSKLEDLEKSIDDVAEVAGNKQIVKSGSSKSTMQVTGRIHIDGWGFDVDDNDNFALINQEAPGEPLDPQNRLGFRRLRFGVKGNIKDNMLYKIEMEFAGGNEVEFRDAYLGWSDLPILQEVLLGNQKRPYGLDHLNSSRFNVFLERPFVIEGFNQDARRLGLASYGFSDNLRWNWRYGVFNQRNVQGLGNYVDDHLQLEVAGRLANTIWYDDISGGRGYAHWAISGTHADSTTNTENGNEARFRTRPEARSESRWLNTERIRGADYFDLLGLEGVVNVGPVQVVGEYQSNWVSRDQGFSDVRFDGGYVYASYFLTGEHMPWDRESGTLDRIIPFQNFWLVNRCDGCREAGWGAWQVAVRYSQADFNDQDIFGGKGEAWTYGMNWYWNPNARLQFNYINGKITDRNVAASGDPLNLVSGRYNIYGVRAMVDF